MGRILWSVRRGEVGEFDGPELMAGFRSLKSEPMLGDYVYLSDGSAWRVVDRRVTDRHDSPENVLVVKSFRD